eukprot:CAMPEP_0172542432 /NCGR_PEP_ID=MMETSP1067-20121228/13042_1 /TAXON_ID=265564 ORGANISM="Thalassiosira punctigera, Strain Tpunct2005C2" /NCGR_SAMPLE_ID=MMETSP1067 /ASSEMBLY_ACC=CAM_ASM_000444 /LENGTH=547 /DNA_ID=CAMNT_0013328673 /DNA_START=118 /DNA_END=1761 /DNA_ORIENTATION=-
MTQCSLPEQEHALSEVAPTRHFGTGEGEPISSRTNSSLKILFLSSDTGGGHRASAESLAVQFQRLFPGTTYDLLDIWSEASCSWPYHTIKDTYAKYSASPWKWRTLYYATDNALYAKFYNAHSCYMNEEKIMEKMEKYNPDVVVSVHPCMNYLPLSATRKISTKLQRYIPFFTVVTDFGSGHVTWFNKEVDKLYLASEQLKGIAQKRAGVPDEKIGLSGLPIRYEFAVQADAMGDRTSERGRVYRAKIREQLNIGANERMILVMGGGEGVGSLSDIVNELYVKLHARKIDAIICVICGRNEKLKDDLETRCWDTVVSRSLRPYMVQRAFDQAALKTANLQPYLIQRALNRVAPKSAKGDGAADAPLNIDVIPLGFVEQMAEFMVAADVLVTKAGPGTIAEAAAVGLPVMVTSYLPGQEAGNVDIVSNGGFGGFLVDPGAIGQEIATWLKYPRLLDKMSQNARKVGHPHAAEEIALDIGKMSLERMDRNELRASQNAPLSEHQTKEANHLSEISAPNHGPHDCTSISKRERSFFFQFNAFRQPKYHIV